VSFWFLIACRTVSPGPAGDPVADMRGRPIELTRHARCRMECRHIDRGEVEHVLATGTLEPGRSRDDGRCPSHALRGTDSEGGPLRVVFAACPTKTRVVTAIDLDDDFPCACD
jgi:hypothetical protein